MITRDERNGMIGGVCAGLAKYFEIDPLIVRLFFVVSVLGFGIGLLPYLILWLIMPSGD